MKVLVVKNPFNGHEIGHAISDRAEMEQVLTGEQAHHVVAAEHPDPETPVEETKTATQE